MARYYYYIIKTEQDNKGNENSYYLTATGGTTRSKYSAIHFDTFDDAEHWLSETDDDYFLAFSYADNPDYAIHIEYID